MSQNTYNNFIVSRKAIKRFDHEIKHDDNGISEKLEYVVKNINTKYEFLLEEPKNLLKAFQKTIIKVFYNSKNFFCKVYVKMLGNEQYIGALKIDKQKDEPYIITNELLFSNKEKNAMAKNNIDIDKMNQKLIFQYSMYGVLSIFDLICPKKIYKYISNPIKSDKKEYSNKIKKYIIISPVRYYYQITRKSSKRKYERKTESWEVRGFTRRYKSGKVVYVKPFTKGKNKNINKKDKILI